MSVMIVGADHLGNIKKNLQMYGMCDIDHMSGRMVSDRKKFSIPRSTSLVVVLTDFVNHGTAKNVKEQAKVQGVQTIPKLKIEMQPFRFRISSFRSKIDRSKTVASCLTKDWR